MSTQGSSSYIYCLGHDMTYKVQILKKCDDYIPEAPDLHNHMNIKVLLKCDQESHAAIQILVLTTLVNI